MSRIPSRSDKRCNREELKKAPAKMKKFENDNHAEVQKENENLDVFYDEK